MLKKILKKWLGIDEIEYRIEQNFNWTLEAFTAVYNNKIVDMSDSTLKTAKKAIEIVQELQEELNKQ